MPTGVSGLSGIALDCAAGGAWVSNTAGTVFHLGQFPCGSSTGIQERTAQPFMLSDIRPNPFESEFSFSIEIKNSNHVKLAIVNILGQEVKLINDGIIETGKHEFTISDTSIPKGVYTLLVVCGTFKDSKRFACVK